VNRFVVGIGRAGGDTVIKLGCDDSLPSKWKWIKAQDYIDVRDGTHDSPKPVVEGIPLVTSKNLVAGKVDFSTCTFISREDHNSISKRSAVDDGDVLYAMIGTIGNPVIVDKTHDFSIKNVALFKFNNVAVYNRYVFHFLNSKLAEQQFRNKSRGGTQKFVSLGNIRELEIPLPPLTEQKRIAAILDKADNLRRKRQQAIKLADEFLRAVFLYMFGDPVTNPKGWPTSSVGNGVKSITSGWSAKGESFPCKEGGLGVLKISAVTSGTFKHTENKSVNPASVPANKKLIFPQRGDLIFSRANTRELVAATCIVQENRSDVFLPDKLWLIKTEESKFLPEFLNYMIWQPRFKDILTSQATGTSGSMLNISKAKFENSMAIYPPLNLQSRFTGIYWKVQRMLSGMNTTDNTTTNLFNSLSQKAFAGQF
jgi:type I restriction enzyme S subunit